MIPRVSWTTFHPLTSPYWKTTGRHTTRDETTIAEVGPQTKTVSRKRKNKGG